MRNTKLVCTLGPSTDADGILGQLIENGMNVARFNFSHGDYEEHRRRIEALKKERARLGCPVAAMLDTKGPEIRLGDFAKGTEKLTAGQEFTLTTQEVPGTNALCAVTYRELPHEVQPGGRIMLDDGLIGLTIREVRDDAIHCAVENDGIIKSKKGVNVPGVHLSMPYMSAKDTEDIRFGAEMGFDLLSASFVRCAQDVLDIRRLLESCGSNMRIIAKIENQEGVDNIDEILRAADGIMVARGDMGVEIDFAEIPLLQKHLIDRAVAAGKTVITATQMLDSMIVNPRPTRAEITDVANAIYDGTSAVMLSGETAAGKYPVEALKAMAAIADYAEKDSNFERMVHHVQPETGRLSVGAATAHAACTTADDIHARAILTVSKSGDTARLICQHRPHTPIIACVMDESVQRQLCISWGVTPLVMSYARSTDELVNHAVERAQTAGMVQEGDTVVVTAGVPVGVSGTTNMIKVHMVGNSLLSGVGIGSRNAEGVACLCRSAEEAMQKCRPGCIVVAPGTNNDYMPYLRQAHGILTEEPGNGSHAAVVGLSLNKAVIVGAAGAMRVLHDGDHISLDCEHGVVQLLDDSPAGTV